MWQGVRHQRVVLAEDFPTNVNRRRAAHVEKQAEVVRLAGALRVDVEPLANPHAGHGALQAVFQREARGQVGRQGKGGDHLRGADRFAACRDPCATPETTSRGPGLDM